MMKHNSHRPVLNYHVVNNIVTNCCLRLISYVMLFRSLTHKGNQLTCIASREKSELSLNYRSRLQYRVNAAEPSAYQVSTPRQLEDTNKRSLGAEIMLSQVQYMKQIWTASR